MILVVVFISSRRAGLLRCGRDRTLLLATILRVIATPRQISLCLSRWTSWKRIQGGPFAQPDTHPLCLFGPKQKPSFVGQLELILSQSLGHDALGGMAIFPEDQMAEFMRHNVAQNRRQR